MKTNLHPMPPHDWRFLDREFDANGNCIADKYYHSEGGDLVWEIQHTWIDTDKGYQLKSSKVINHKN